MKFDLPHSVALLERTPATLRALLLDLPSPWIESNEGAKTWSPRQVVAHFVDGEETDWIPRMNWILERGASCPFEPFDRFRHETWARDLPIAEMLDRFAKARAASLEKLRARKLTAGDLMRDGVHPALGPVTIEQLLATWVAHDLNHVFQIVRTMARQYDEAVGPWKVYLRVLNVPPHAP